MFITPLSQISRFNILLMCTLRFLGQFSNVEVTDRVTFYTGIVLESKSWDCLTHKKVIKRKNKEIKIKI